MARVGCFVERSDHPAMQYRVSDNVGSADDYNQVLRTCATTCSSVNETEVDDVKHYNLNKI